MPSGSGTSTNVPTTRGRSKGRITTSYHSCSRTGTDHRGRRPTCHWTNGGNSHLFCGWLLHCPTGFTKQWSQFSYPNIFSFHPTIGPLPLQYTRWGLEGMFKHMSVHTVHTSRTPCQLPKVQCKVRIIRLQLLIVSGRWATTSKSHISDFCQVQDLIVL